MENDEELKPCPFCGGEACKMIEEVTYSTPQYSVQCQNCKFETLMFDYEAEAVSAWNSRNYPEKQDSSKELMDFVKFCRNASANDIMQIHDRARDLISKHKECCKYAECKDGREINFPSMPACTTKEEDATLKPLIPKWKIRGDVQELVLNLSQKAKLEFIINTKILNVMSYIVDDDIAISCKEVGTFDTLKDAKTKVNECIKDLGEMLVYFAENIKTNQ